AKGVLRKKGSALAPASPGHHPEDVFHARVWPGKDYVPPQYSGKVTLFRARRQPYWRVRDFRNGWGDRALGGVEVHLIQGDHATITREPHVQILARQLADCFAKAGAAATETATTSEGVPSTT